MQQTAQPSAPPQGTFRTILGSNHGKKRSRIWLEGARLTAAGFQVGTRYHRNVFGVGIGISLSVNPQGRYKVSGKAGKPVIDLTGHIVSEIFPEPLTHVTVSFTPDLVTITP